MSGIKLLNSDTRFLSMHFGKVRSIDKQKIKHFVYLRAMTEDEQEILWEKRLEINPFKGMSESEMNSSLAELCGQFVGWWKASERANIFWDGSIHRLDTQAFAHENVQQFSNRKKQRA